MSWDAFFFSHISRSAFNLMKFSTLLFLPGSFMLYFLCAEQYDRNSAVVCTVELMLRSALGGWVGITLLTWGNFLLLLLQALLFWPVCHHPACVWIVRNDYIISCSSQLLVWVIQCICFIVLMMQLLLGAPDKSWVLVSSSQLISLLLLWGPSWKPFCYLFIHNI